jgi:3-hydroxybutyryl-CoA dehydratase
MTANEFSRIFPQKFIKNFIVDELVYKTFQACSCDLNPLHVDENYAIDKGFKGKVMYGNILNAFISYIVGECLPTKEVIIHSQTINYLLPVYLNDSLKLELSINEIYESVNAIDLKFIFRNVSEKVVSRGVIQIGLLA